VTKSGKRGEGATDRKWLVYHRRTEEERQALAESQAAESMVDLGDGIVYANVMGLPTHTAHVRGTNTMMDGPRRREGFVRVNCP
jgi:hypothetical protein